MKALINGYLIKVNKLKERDHWLWGKQYLVEYNKGTLCEYVVYDVGPNTRACVKTAKWLSEDKVIKAVND